MHDVLRHKRGIRRALLAWYGREKRTLPWRDAADPYVVWLSEVMLQQTRVEQGTPYIVRFVKQFPDVQALAAASEDAVLKAWEGLGYYSRARNLHKAARVIAHDRAGAFPATAEDWQTLPGVGRYTAGAVASIAYGERAPVLDGNVKRVLARLTDLSDPVDDAAVTDSLWDLAGELVRGKSPGDFNQAIMELGANVCTPRRPACEACPLTRYCAAYAAGTQEQRPVRREKKPVPHKEIVVAVIKRNGRYLIGKRPPNGLLGGLWEFPGGKVNPGEDHPLALMREVREELNLGVRVGGLIACVSHAYTHFRVTLNVYACSAPEGTPQPSAHTELRWVRKSEFSDFAFPKANHKFLHLL
ncbi:MAG: A/G-specific adenine glycosylase [Candidatus Hydrogenedentales bacterium]